MNSAAICFVIGFIFGMSLTAIISVNAYNKQAEELQQEIQQNEGLSNVIFEISNEQRKQESKDIFEDEEQEEIEVSLFELIDSMNTEKED